MTQEWGSALISINKITEARNKPKGPPHVYDDILDQITEHIALYPFRVWWQLERKAGRAHNERYHRTKNSRRVHDL